MLKTLRNENLRLKNKVQQLERTVSWLTENTATAYKTAFIRNQQEPYTIPVSRTLLQNDGLRTGGFNTFGYDIWDASTQTLRPNKIGERFFVRITFSAKANTAVVIDIDLDAGGYNINSPTRFQPFVSGEWETQSILLSFFVGGAFAPDGQNITNSAQFYISPTQETDITNLSFDIFAFG